MLAAFTRPLVRFKPLSGYYSTVSEKVSPSLKGKRAVVGVYDSEAGVDFTEDGSQLDAQLSGKIRHLIDISGPKLKDGEARLFYDVSEELTHLVVVQVGKRDPPEGQEDIIVARENVRVASGVSAMMLQKAKVKEIVMDHFGDAEAAAEGAQLALYQYTDMKGKNEEKAENPLLTFTSGKSQEAWSRGLTLAEAQNFARWLMDTPSNHMTPTNFVSSVSKRLGQLDEEVKKKMEIYPRPLSWIKEKNMGAFLAVAKGSCEEPWFLEIKYNGGKEAEKPLALVGKGITFDTGGVSIKPAASMGDMKADMGGAACVAGATLAIASLGIPLNLVAMMPLCENMVSGKAFKPGDVVTAMSGKTIEVSNTDAEGRLILADALHHVHSYDPEAIIDLATLTGLHSMYILYEHYTLLLTVVEGAMAVALGRGAAGTFSTSDSLWTLLHQASRRTGDRLWRMPLYKQYRKQIDSPVADLNNIGTMDRMAGSCTAAAFLKDFVSVDKWSHLDIAGVMDTIGEIQYLKKGMAGRPTRTLIEFAKLFA